MEHGAKEKLHTVGTEAGEPTLSTAYVDIEIDINHVKQEPAFVEDVKSEPMFLVKEEIQDDSRQGTSKQLSVPATLPDTTMGTTSVAAGSNEQSQLIHIKKELENADPDMEPNVLQPIDSHYKTNQGVELENTITNREEGLFKTDERRPVQSQARKQTTMSSSKDNAAIVQCNSVMSTKLVQSEIYTCEVCKKSFKNKAASKLHVKCVHGSDHLKCPDCNKHFRCQQYLNDHIVTVHSQHQYRCDICRQVFKSTKILTDHIKFVHEMADSPSIDNCLKKLRGKTELVSLQENLRGSKQLEVDKNNFQGQLNLSKQNEEINNSDVKKRQCYKCNICQKVYKSDKYLRRHSKGVHGTESLKCTLCDKLFKCKLYLSRHIKFTHSQEHYECDICKKMYKSRAGLNNHVSSFHRYRFAGPEDGNYSCDKCMKTFQSKKVYMSHCKNIHGTEQYKCTECNREYKCMSYLRSHITLAHSKQQYECDMCKKVYKSKRALRGHILSLHNRRFTGSLVRKFTCDICQKSYKQKSVLRQHIEGVHGERIHRCQQCNKTFKTRNHLHLHKSNIHSKSQNECEVCHKVFASRYVWRTHIKKAHGVHYLHPVVHFQDMHNTIPIVNYTSPVVSAHQNSPPEVPLKSEQTDAELETGPVEQQHMGSNFRACKEETQSN